MTHLQQTCADMVSSQENLRKLLQVNRAQLAGRWPNSLVDRLSVAIGIARHSEYLEVCGKSLLRHPAANDSTILPGAA
jgi:hypothetical protein